MTGDLASSPFPSTADPSPTFTIPDDARPTIPASSCPDHEGVIGENNPSQQRLIDAGAGSWEFSDMFNFDDLNMDFNFDGPSTSSSVPMDLSAHSSTVPTTHDAYTSVLPTKSSTAAAGPTPISLNDNVDYRPPCPPPLVSRFPESHPTSSAATSSIINTNPPLYP
jgi:hypothetical protein